MSFFFRLARILLGLLRHIVLLPRSLSVARRSRRRQKASHRFEIERLDRIRHPAKYLGK